MTQFWNLGVLGCGMIVRRGHLPGLLSSEKARVSVIYGPDTPNSRQVASIFKIPRLVHSFREFFETPSLDAVVVALPNHQHGPAALMAIEAGLPILLEKPIASDIATARNIVAAANAKKVRISISLPQRQRPSVLRLKDLINSGTLGRLESIDIRMTRRAGIPGYGGWFTQQALAGGGVLMDLGPHVIDTVFWLARCSKACNIRARFWKTHGPVGRGLGDWGSQRKSGEPVFDVEDRVWFAMDLACGVHVTCEVAWAVYGGDENLIRIVGNRGGAQYSPEQYGSHSPLRLYRDGDDGRPADCDDQVPADHDALEPAWAKVASTFVADLDYEQSHLASGDEALIASELIQELYDDSSAVTTPQTER